MENESLKIFFRGFRLLKQFLSIESIFSRLAEVNHNFNVNALKEELSQLLSNQNFDWADLALETGFVYSPKDSPRTQLDVDNLLIYTDAAQWRYNFPDGRPSKEDRERLKDQFRTIDLNKFSDIHQIMDSDEFAWVQFEVKRSFKLSFGEIYYTNNDIIYEVKRWIWDYLFPNSIKPDLLKAAEDKSRFLINNYELNDGWMDMDDLVLSLSSLSSEIDLYYLTKIKWGSDIQKLNHFRNPFAMGFKRLRR